jgi:hypothetical protein
MTRLGLKGVTHTEYISVCRRWPRQRDKKLKAILVANTVPPSNKIAPTIDLFGNDGTLVSTSVKQTDILTLQCCSRTPYTRRSSRYQPFFAQIATDDTLPIEARMTQMGRSCKVIQKQVKLCCFIPISYRSHWSGVVSNFPVHLWRRLTNIVCTRQSR